jgi:hypothetical protein
MTSKAHILRPLSATLVATAALAVVAWVAAPARALDETKPTPTCAGVAFTDPKGDQTAGTGANLDVTSGFFKYTENLTANIVISDLNQDIPPGATGVNWYFVWNVGGVDYFVEAGVDITGATEFSYGTLEAGTGFTQIGDTTGKFFEGADGVIQITVPPAAKGAEGQVLKTPYVTARTFIGIPGVGGLVSSADEAPNSNAGKTYTVAPCDGGAAAAPVALPVTFATKSARASKTKKGKSLTLKLRSTETVTELTGRILSRSTKKPTVYGTGKLARLETTGNLKVKLRRALKKGTYRVELTGTTAFGEKGTVTSTLRVR